MTEQPFLLGFEVPPGRRPPVPRGPRESGGNRPSDHFFFFAFLPVLDAANDAFALARSEKARRRLRGKPIPQERLHISLASLGYYFGRPGEMLELASTAARDLADSTSPIEMSFHRLGSFTGRHGNRPLVLRDDGHNYALMRSQQRLWQAVGGTGRSGFTPHITLLYDEQLVPEKEVRPIRWTATEFVLIHSFVGQSRYEALGRWPLHGQN